MIAQTEPEPITTGSSNPLGPFAEAHATPAVAQPEVRPMPIGAGRTSGQAHRFDMEALVGYILSVGVLTSLGLIIAGLAWHWGRTGQLGIDYSLSGMNFFEFLLKDLQQIAGGEMRPRLLVSLGITTLMLTPYVRVLASMLYFAVGSRNWKYTAFTGFVLAILTYSLFLR